MKKNNTELKFLRQLATNFPTAAEAATEIINLEAILSLPKGTEHFLADVHGEYEAFNHVLKNASGSIARKVEELFGRQIRNEEKRELCTLIYYPKEKLAQLNEKKPLCDDWYMVTLNQLVKVCRKVSEKYTRSKFRKTLPPQYSYIIEELVHEEGTNQQKSAYISSIFNTIIQIGKAEDFIVAICETIQKLVIDHLHIVGDIFDRGPGPQHILDTLLNYHNVDIQWGNHDMLWMGASAGNAACMANCVRIALRYANLDTLENAYGINLLPLARFAMETYANDPCTVFKPKLSGADELYDDKSVYLISQMHKAMSIMQFKLEHLIIVDHPEYNMSERDLLHRWNKAEGTIKLPDGNVYPMLDNNLPTIDPKNPYKLTEGEENVIKRLLRSFAESERLKKHIAWFYRKGSMYLSCNMNLLYHASVPLNEDRTLKEVLIEGKYYKGKDLYDKVDELVRRAHQGAKGTASQKSACDFMWYLWCGPNSPLFDKSAMTTFERYFIEDKATHHEQKGYYYTYRQEQDVCEMILKEFGLEGPDTHIINGHVPVKVKKGDKPLLGGGKLLVIDGGFSRAYQSSTGIAGYTLIFNSRGLQLVQHEPFTNKRDAVENMKDIKSVTVVKEHSSHRILVRDTDKGHELITQVEDLKKLLEAYKYRYILEKGK